MKIIKLMALVFSVLSFESAFANAPFVCKTDASEKHQITVTINDEVYSIQDNWNGPYKTEANYRGTILPVSSSIILRNAERNQYVTAILAYNAETKVFTLEYSGFLAPDKDGLVEVKCATVR